MTVGRDALRTWLLRAAAPPLLLVANICGVQFTTALLRKAALAVAYITALTGAAVYWRIAVADERVRTVRAPAPSAADGFETLSVRDYDTRALKQLCSSILVVRSMGGGGCALCRLTVAGAFWPPQGLGVAWLMHSAGYSSTLITLQTRAFAGQSSAFVVRPCLPDTHASLAGSAAAADAVRVGARAPALAARARVDAVAAAPLPHRAGEADGHVRCKLRCAARVAALVN